MNRRSIASLLIGVLASILGLLAVMRIRANRCLARGGEWDEARRLCRVPAGTTGESFAQVATAYVLGAIIMLVIGFVLYRLFLAATGRGPRR